MRIQQVCDCTPIKSQIITRKLPVLNKIFMSFCPPPKEKYLIFYKFCNILIPGRAGPGRTKQFAGRAGNFGLVDTSSRQHPDVLVNIQDSKIASEFISFRDQRRFFYGTFK